MAVRETPEARRAALLLHSLAVGERRRVFSRLTAAESAMLAPLLDELKELGVSPSLGRQLQAEAQVPQPEAAAEQTPATLNPQQIAHLLESCDALTVAQLLRAKSWPWEAQVLESILPARKFAVMGMMSEVAPLGPAAQRVLCDCFEQRGSQPRLGVRHPAEHGVAELAVSPFQSGGWSAVRSGFRRLLSWMR
jgi:hypothetical protein